MCYNTPHGNSAQNRDQRLPAGGTGLPGWRGGLVPLIVPVTLVNHSVRKYKESYLAGKIYLNPHPLELTLRNHV